VLAAVAVIAAAGAGVIIGVGGSGGPGSSRLAAVARPASLFSQDDQQKFMAWFNYEVITLTDRSRSESDVRLAGVAACTSMRQDHGAETAVSQIKDRMGFDRTGAEAVVAAAVRALCPELNFGYRTSFDRNVAMAQELIRNGWHQQPDEFGTGLTAKLVCEHLALHSADGLTELLTSHGTPSGAPIKLTVRAVVGAQCPALSDKLGPYWYDI
jgi:Protein of unknown function (DUF732)